MKKVVLLTFAVLAFICQGAYVDWKVSFSKADAGKSVYAFTSDRSELLANLASGDSDVWLSTLNGALKTGTLNATRGQWSAQGVDGVDASTMLTFVVIDPAGAVDGSNYLVSESMSISTLIYTPPQTTPGALAVSSANFTNSGVFTKSGDTPDPIDPGPGGSGGVPEPTSGLLFLVGASLLALRRKQK